MEDFAGQRSLHNMVHGSLNPAALRSEEHAALRQKGYIGRDSNGNTYVTKRGKSEVSTASGKPLPELKERFEGSDESKAAVADYWRHSVTGTGPRSVTQAETGITSYKGHTIHPSGGMHVLTDRRGGQSEEVGSYVDKDSAMQEADRRTAGRPEKAEKSYETGPRGGQYYTSASGQKVYGKPSSSSGSFKGGLPPSVHKSEPVVGHRSGKHLG